ncbi:hypothetical protein B0I35DRAFT_427517 [Stachybotrys elegans]|uniref:Fungal N-terminal domain-containing protein n=1 Tax=Stachybotrys elegans TaxID=80388 RepID=A0A8K0SXJ6_9HYPO|nr:hypothetical protein B0I35DRAFT_427517 [Stachybotrys elegans]
MDPLSAIGLVSSVVSFAELIAKTISKLTNLKSRYDDAPLQIATLIGQLFIIKAAVEQLSGWKSSRRSHDQQQCHLALQMEQCLASFSPLIASLEHHLRKIEVAARRQPKSGRRKKLCYLWNESQISTYLVLIDRHTNALNLFLQAIQYRTVVERKSNTKQNGSRAVVKSARNDTSELPTSDSKGVKNVKTILGEPDFGSVTPNASICGFIPLQSRYSLSSDTRICITRVDAEPMQRLSSRTITARAALASHTSLSSHPSTLIQISKIRVKKI